MYVVYSAVKTINKSVTFGISPASDMDYDYSALYADVIKWSRNEGYIDYICPQIYFGFKNENQPFMQTTKLWCDNATCALYIALPMYKSGLSDEYAGESGKNEFKKEKNIVARQITYISKIDKIKGYYQMWRNPAVSDTYEPGSTFKLITSSAGIEEGVVKESDKFTCTGSLTIGGRRIKCWRHYRPHGEQTFAEGVQNSCNPVFMTVAERLGVAKMYDYIEAFGFMEKTGIDLPGEAKGIVYNEKNVGPVELATMSFGQSISVTPMQLIRAISTIANDGKMMQPRVVKGYTDNKGNVIEEIEPKMIRQVVSEDTADRMMKIAESVVSKGGGHAAYIPGYRIGGKTGTAQKVVDGRYAQGKYICSFMGIAPTDDPQIVVLAIVDEPTGVSAFGSTTAGPIIKEIMSEVLPYLGVEPVYTEEEKKELQKNQVVVPDIRNLAIEDAVKILEESNLKANLDPDIEIPEGSKVVDMFPKPGVKVDENSSIMLYFNN